ncbi:MAG: GTPase HflX [Spirochaetales bacterium]|nr:GTPase HflX [Spirochaetales bacterium]
MNNYSVRGIPDKALLIGVKLSCENSPWSVEDSLDELVDLADTAGVVVEARLFQNLDKPVPATFIGSGKIDEARELVDRLEINTVIFDDELLPGQQRNLEKAFGDEVNVIDRTALILDIFAQHAHSREGKLQVELAQYEYRLPRLTGMWVHLARQAGGKAGGGLGGVGVRGPGETQLEVDRRLIQKKIQALKQELRELKKQRHEQRKNRGREKMPVAALVGYTNAGKSSLLKSLSGSDVYIEDKLFATLDPKTRRVNLPSGAPILITDTVGFIKKLPHHLVAAFGSTLEGISEADFVLHVLDVAHPMVVTHRKTTEDVLATLGVDHEKMIRVWNKIDLLEEHSVPFHNSQSDIYLSAREEKGCDKLLELLENRLEASMEEVALFLPYSQTGWFQSIQDKGRILKQEYRDTGIEIQALLPLYLKNSLREFIVVGV